MTKEVKKTGAKKTEAKKKACECKDRRVDSVILVLEEIINKLTDLEKVVDKIRARMGI